MNSRFSVWKIAAAAGVLALAVTGCGSSSGKPASAPKPTTTTAAPTQAIVSATQVRVLP
ncbi:MAG: hypothetical protein QOC79_992, partial [Actinomycetota bacterium]|nr:hypothetical protein [Actinomycetota bacterium]